MTDPELVRNPVEILAEEFLERYRRGERPTVTEYVDRHRDLSGEICEVFPALLAIEEVGPHAAVVGSPRHTSARGNGSIPERLGDFRIVGEIGRGGMGVVYEAVKESLCRQVALKVLPRGALADPAALKRFRREARSVAALHHSNIVPVFGIGEHAGHHYYAMQLIRGQTLEAVLGGVRRLRDFTDPLPAKTLSQTERAATEIAGCLVEGRFNHSTTERAGGGQNDETTERLQSGGLLDRAAAASCDQSGAAVTSVTIAERGESQYHRRIARIGLHVAEALGYAHDQGVLHRDIKPSNLLMDEEGTVWVLDLGLAKTDAVGEQSASRDIVGTLRYMATERFDGRTDRRSDVFGLGITLYELLTLQPAFDAAQQAALIHQVLHGAPKSPRHVDRRIPRDLETIVLKAMAKEPSARYASAHALSEDLRRFLENRTILARRSTSLERTGRWCRRNPAVAALLTSVVALLAFIAGYYSVSATRYRHQFERALTAEIDGREKLFTSYVAQARASRFSRRPGQRFAALRALTEAAKIHRTPELRAEAIAAMALSDLDEIHRSAGPISGVRLAFDPTMERYALFGWDGIVSVRRVIDDREIQRFPSPGPVGESFVLAFSPDGQSDLLTTVKGERIAESSNGRILARCQDYSNPVVLDLDHPASPIHLGPQGDVRYITVSPDGRWVATGSHSCSKTATFSADGSRLILTSQDGRWTRVWDLRVIRQELVVMGLGWDSPPLPEPSTISPAAGPLRIVTDLGGHDFSWGSSEPQELGRLNEALEIEPGDIHAMVRRGCVNDKSGRYDEAIADYTRALAIRPGDPRIMAARGSAYLSKKQYAQGIAECEASLAAVPDQAAVQNSLAWVYATAPAPFRDQAKALPHARAALRLSPKIGTYHNTLGVALYRAGQYRDALTELETSLAAGSQADAPIDLFFLAMCHVHLGDTARAKVDFERACHLQAEVRRSAGNVEELEAIKRETKDVLGR
jgi:serine/threonine protein kinase/Tfp pilus assembly protein PilF